MKLSIEDVHDNGAYRVEVRGGFERITTAIAVLINDIAIKIKVKPETLLMFIRAKIECRKDALDNAIRIDLEDERDTD